MMQKLGKILRTAIVALVCVLISVMAGFAWYFRDIPADYIAAKYGSRESKFITIDGVRFHYLDEGPKEAPAVVLIHAHWASLIMWDAWANALSDKYRVVRFDMAGHGLTGPDPSGDYSTDRGVALFEQFADTLGLDTFDIMGTSLGGTHALHFAAKAPNRVNRLVLLNPGALNAGVRGRDTPRPLPWWIDVLTVVTPRAFFEFMLKGGYGDPSTVDPAIVERWHEIQLLEGQRRAELTRTSQYISGDIESKIRSISVPTLIIWGEDNPVVTVDQGYEFIELLENSPEKNLIIYPGLGHMAALEDPQTTARDIRRYVDGTYDFDK